MDEHEFTEQDNGVIRGLARMMLVAASCWLLLGCFNVLILLVVGLIPGIIFIALGVNLAYARGAMRAIVETEGNDIKHLMAAMVALKNYFRIMGICFVLLSAFIVVMWVVQMGG